MTEPLDLEQMLLGAIFGTDPNEGIDETARDHDAEALADLGDVGDLDQYDRSTQ